MTDLIDIAKPFADLDSHVDVETERKITRWVHAEARFLDAERYEEWLDGFIDKDVQYWMPDMETRRRDDARGMFCYGESAYFDDNWSDLQIRVKRYNEPSAWADNPQTRHAHLISNIEVFATEDPALFAVHSAFTNVRNRNEADQDIIHGRREDVLNVSGDGFAGYRLLRRRVFIVQNVLLSKNLNTFF